MSERPESSHGESVRAGDYSGFDVPKRIFLQHMWRTQSRADAASQAGVSWTMVGSWLREDEDFEREYQELMDVRRVICEDAIFLAARNDRNAAAAARTLDLLKKGPQGSSTGSNAAADELRNRKNRARAILDRLKDGVS